MKSNHVSNLLRHAGRLLMLSEATRATSIAIAVLIGSVLLAVILDVVFALRPMWLFAMDCVLLVVACGAAAYIARQIYRKLFNARHMARLIEQKAGIRDSQLINAIDLKRNPQPNANRALVERSIVSGEWLAATISPRVVVESRPLKKAILTAVAALVVVIVLAVTVPGMLSAVANRLLNPAGNHPPFTLLNFDVQVEPHAIYFGHPATIRATISGPGAPDRANVVFVEQHEAKKFDTNSAVAMLRSDESNQAGQVFVLPVDRADKSRTFYIEASGGRSELFTLNVLPVPVFKRVAVQYNFPEYTGWPAATKALDGDGIRALRGTEIVVTTTSNLPLGSGWIEMDVADPVKPQAAKMKVKLEPLAADPATVRGSFIISSNCRFDMTLTGADGTPGDEHKQGSIAAIADKGPAIEITQPAQHVVVPEDYPVGVSIRANDDIGVKRITLNRSINSFAASEIELPLVIGDQPTQAVTSYVFDLPALGAHGGDVITYFATAFDNHPTVEGKGQFTDSPTHVIEVITMEEYEEFARTEYRMEQIMQEQQAFQRRLDELKSQRDMMLDQLEPLKQKAQSGEAMSAEDMQKMTELEEALKNYDQQARELSSDLRARAEEQPLYEFEKPWQDSLKSLSEKLDQQAQNAQAAEQSMEEVQEQQAQEQQQQDSDQQQQKQQKSAAARKNMGEQLEKFQKESQPFDEQTQQETQQTEKDLEAMQQADDMVQQAERIRQVILQQRDLTDRIDQYSDKKELSPSEQLRVHRMADEQEQLREELKDATEKLEQAAEKAQERLPKMSGQAQQLCQKIGELQVDSDQAHAAESAREAQPREAHQSAEKAARNLETLLSGCESEQMQQQASDELDGCLKLPKPGMKNSMEQMAQSRQAPGMGKQGKSGSGMNGSQTPMQVMGPHQQRVKNAKGAKGESDKPPRMTQVQSSSGGDGVVGVASTEKTGAENLTPESMATRATSAGAMSGVPVQYRDQAEAYFKRLAEESKKKKPR